MQLGQQLIVWLKHKPKNFGTIHYVVQPGDSLSQIATHFNTSSKLLKLANHMQTSFIRIDDQLDIPSYIRKQTTSPLLASAESKNYKLQMVTYHVKAGDNLTTIANKLGVTIKQLEEWNTLDPKTYLHAGQPLKITQQSTG